MTQPDDDDLLGGKHQLGAGRTIDLETLLAASHVIGNLATGVRRLPLDTVKTLRHVLNGGVFHAADVESLLDPSTASEDDLRNDLEASLLALLQRLRKVNHAVD